VGPGQPDPRVGGPAVACARGRINAHQTGAEFSRGRERARESQQPRVGDRERVC